MRDKQDCLEVCTLLSELSRLGLNLQLCCQQKLSSWCLIGRVNHPCVCRPSDGCWTRNLICLDESVDVNDPTVSFVKSRRTIAGTMNKFKILALTSWAGVVTWPALWPSNCFSSTDSLPRVWYMNMMMIIELMWNNHLNTTSLFLLYSISTVVKLCLCLFSDWELGDYLQNWRRRLWSRLQSKERQLWRRGTTLWYTSCVFLSPSGSWNSSWES